MGLHPSVDKTGTVLVAHVDTTHDPLGAGDAFSSIITFPLGSVDVFGGMGQTLDMRGEDCDLHRSHHVVRVTLLQKSMISKRVLNQVL